MSFIDDPTYIANQINALYMQKSDGKTKPNQARPLFLLYLVRNCKEQTLKGYKL